MRIRLILSFLLLLPVVAAAQVKFGYISYAEVCQQMPAYQQAQQQLAELKKKYEDEATREEEEFQRKFADFLQGQKDFPANILQKRQAELQDIMERAIDFRKDAESLLSKAEKDMMQGVYDELNTAIMSVATEQGYAFVLNTDGNSVPFINPQMGEDVTNLVLFQLGIIKELPKPIVDELEQVENNPVLEQNAEPAMQETPEQKEAPKEAASQEAIPQQKEKDGQTQDSPAL